eukprot:scaffold292164_cov28-Tisochrysis_lutea.AAC.3
MGGAAERKAAGGRRWGAPLLGILDHAANVGQEREAAKCAASGGHPLGRDAFRLFVMDHGKKCGRNPTMALDDVVQARISAPLQL